MDLHQAEDIFESEWSEMVGEDDPHGSRLIAMAITLAGLRIEAQLQHIERVLRDMHER